MKRRSYLLLMICGLLITAAANATVHRIHARKASDGLFMLSKVKTAATNQVFKKANPVDTAYGSVYVSVPDNYYEWEFMFSDGHGNNYILDSDYNTNRNGGYLGDIPVGTYYCVSVMPTNPYYNSWFEFDLTWYDHDSNNNIVTNDVYGGASGFGFYQYLYMYVNNKITNIGPDYDNWIYITRD